MGLFIKAVCKDGRGFGQMQTTADRGWDQRTAWTSTS